MIVRSSQITQAKISLDLVYTSGKSKLFRKTSGTAGVCDSAGDIFLFVSTGEIPEHDVKRNVLLNRLLLFSHKMHIIEVLTAHSH